MISIVGTAYVCQGSAAGGLQSDTLDGGSSNGSRGAARTSQRTQSKYSKEVQKRWGSSVTAAQI